MKRLASTIGFLLCSLVSLYAQQLRIIKLEQKNTDTITRFHIVSVIDDRADTDDIGFVRSSAFLNKKMIANLENGASACISQFLKLHVLQDPSTPAVELHITYLSISERPDAIKEKSTLKLGLAFYMNGQFVTELKGKSSTIATDATLFIDMLIRKSIVGYLKEFDKYLAEMPH